MSRRTTKQRRAARRRHQEYTHPWKRRYVVATIPAEEIDAAIARALGPSGPKPWEWLKIGVFE